MKQKIFFFFIIFTGMFTNNAFSQAIIEPKINLIKSGCNSYLIQFDSGCILVDAGSHKKMKAFKNIIKEACINWTDIKYIVITHTHYDHVANLAELKALTGAKIIIHSNEQQYIASGNTPLPSGMNFFGKVGLLYTRNFGMKNVLTKPVNADIVISENYLISEFNCKIIHNPGHSNGSISMIINDTICFCGDAAFSIMGNNLMPVTGDDKNQILESWQLLLNSGCTRFYPGHGKPFDAHKLKKSLDKNRKKLH